MTSPIFTGVGVALVTIFNSSGELDAGATVELANRLVEAGIRSVVVAGSNGEAASLEASERAALVGAVRAGLPPDIVVLAGSGAPSARQAARSDRGGSRCGRGRRTRALSPAELRPRPYYETVAKAAGGASVLGYHFPSVSFPGLAVEVLGDLPIAGHQRLERRRPAHVRNARSLFRDGSTQARRTSCCWRGRSGAGERSWASPNLEPEMW